MSLLTFVHKILLFIAIVTAFVLLFELAKERLQQVETTKARLAQAQNEAIQLKATVEEAERSGQELLQLVESIRIIKDYPWKEELETRLKKESENTQEILNTWVHKMKSPNPFVVTVPHQDRCNNHEPKP